MKIRIFGLILSLTCERATRTAPKSLQNLFRKHYPPHRARPLKNFGYAGHLTQSLLALSPLELRAYEVEFYSSPQTWDDCPRHGFLSAVSDKYQSYWSTLQLVMLFVTPAVIVGASLLLQDTRFELAGFIIFMLGCIVGPFLGPSVVSLLKRGVFVWNHRHWYRIGWLRLSDYPGQLLDDRVARIESYIANHCPDKVELLLGCVREEAGKRSWNHPPFILFLRFFEDEQNKGAVIYDLGPVTDMPSWEIPQELIANPQQYRLYTNPRLAQPDRSELEDLLRNQEVELDGRLQAHYPEEDLETVLDRHTVPAPTKTVH